MSAVSEHYESLVEAFASHELPSIVPLLDAILSHAYELHASDIHIDPCEHFLRIRIRVHGELVDAHRLSLHAHQGLLFRLKVLAELRTDEHRVPQDGRFRFHEKHERCDVRVAIAPSYYGERAVLRLLRSRAESETLETLGCSEEYATSIQQCLQKPSGLILITGATGSGKTSTLYTLLHFLNKPEKSLVTVEDPIEYSLQGITQMQVDQTTHFTFAEGLRSILRQDPDIIAIGEIRDRETAALAVHAALTGHLVLSTLHANSAAGAIPRLQDLGVDPFLITTTLRMVMHQCLVRKLCEGCHRRIPLSTTEQQIVQELGGDFNLSHSYHAVGCASCGGKGYTGRTGVFELLEQSDKFMQNRERTLLHDLLIKVSQGVISLSDALSNIYA